MSKIKHGSAALALVCAILFIQTTASIAAGAQRYAGYAVDELIELYVHTSLTAEGGLSTVDHRLVKWPADKTVRVITIPLDSVFDTPGQHTQLIARTKRIVDRIAAATDAPGIDALGVEEMRAFVQVAPPADPHGALKDHVVVLFGSQAELIGAAKSWASLPGPEGLLMTALLPHLGMMDQLCFGIWVADPSSYRLAGAFVLIDAVTPQLDQCIYEEVMQSFGLMNDFPAGTHSIFNDDNVFEEPTYLDWFLWQVHQDPRLEAGMDEAAVRRVARDVIESLIAE